MIAHRLLLVVVSFALAEKAYDCARQAYKKILAETTRD